MAQPQTIRIFLPEYLIPPLFEFPRCVTTYANLPRGVLCGLRGRSPRLHPQAVSHELEKMGKAMKKEVDAGEQVGVPAIPRRWMGAYPPQD